MDPLYIGYIGIVALLLLLAIGVHIGVALGLVGMVGMGYIIGFDASFNKLVGSMYHKIASFDLITIPLFILMGFLASGGGMSKNIFDTLNKWIGSIRGGLGMSTVVSCSAFGTVCGSSLVTASVFANICAPEMRKKGYSGKIAYGICASAGMIGMLIPPSILMIVYGVLSGESTGKLLIAGFVPGILLMIMFSATVVYITIRKPHLIKTLKDQEKYSWGDRFKSLFSIWQVILVAFIIFGGIFGGVFNPTEAAAVAAVALLIIIAVTRFKELKHLLIEAFTETATTSCMIFLVMGGAAVFSHFLVLTGIPDTLAHYVLNLGLSTIVLICVILVFYGILGCFLDSISILCITIPLFNPIMAAAGVDMIWYAVLVVMAIESGLITPPVGLNVYAAYAVAEPDIRLEDIFAGIFPFFIVTWLAVLVLLLFPALSTFLPKLMIG